MKQKIIFILITFIIIVVIVNAFILKTLSKTRESNSNIQGRNVIKLINVANQYSIVADGTGNTKLLTDGNPDTKWYTNDSKWPATLTIALPIRGIIADELVLNFIQESQFPDRSVNINIQYEIVGKEEPEITETSDFKFFSNVYSFVFPENSLVSKIIITLSNPKEGGSLGQFWPALQEIELYSPK